MRSSSANRTRTVLPAVVVVAAAAVAAVVVAVVVVVVVAVVVAVVVVAVVVVVADDDDVVVVAAAASDSELPSRSPAAPAFAGLLLAPAASTPPVERLQQLQLQQWATNQCVQKTEQR